MVAPGEPLWLPDDLDAAVAYERWLLEDHAARCPRCRTRRADWVDDQGRPLRQPPYVAHVVDCVGCQELAESRPDSHDPGVKQGWRTVELVPFDPEPDPEAD